MAVDAWQGELFEQGTPGLERRPIPARRPDTEGGFELAARAAELARRAVRELARWASAIGVPAVVLGVAALAIFTAWGGYSVSAESNLGGVFGVAFALGLVLGGRGWFR